jgi:hypothetical protein
MLSAADLAAIAVGLLTLPLQLGALVLLLVLISPVIAVFSLLLAFWAAVYLVTIVPAWLVIALVALPRQLGTLAFATMHTSVLSFSAKLAVLLALPLVAATLLISTFVSSVVVRMPPAVQCVVALRVMHCRLS